jgi:vitamin B12 transporter
MPLPASRQAVPLYFLLLALGLAAQGSSPPEASASGTMEISSRLPEERLAPAAGRSRMDAEDIAASGAETVEELVEALSGVAVSDAGASGARSAVSIRGSTTNSVLVIIDGVPASDPATGLADLSELGLSPEDIESIEVVKGGASAQYGPDASAGVVVIRTKGARGRKAFFEAEASNLLRIPFASVSGSGFGALASPPSALSLADGQSLSLRGALPGGIALSASLERAKNAYSYEDANGLVRSRDNADLLSASSSFSWEKAFPAGALSAKASVSARDIGVPGPSTAPTPEARQRDGRARLSFSYSTDSFFSDAVAFSLGAHALGIFLRYAENGGEGETALSARAGADAAWSLLFGKHFELGAGFSGRWEALDSASVQDGSGSPPSRVSAGAYAEPRLAFGPWSLSPAARLDWSTDYGLSPSFSLGTALRCSESLVASVAASTAYRAPSFDDLYWPADPGTAGNPDLLPEKSYGGEARADYSAGAATASMAVFARYVEDVILWQPGTDSIWRPSNWGEALYPGAEASAGLGLGNYEVRASWTFLRTYALSGDLELGDEVRVPMVPEHSLDARFGYRKGDSGWGLSLSYAGPRYLSLANAESLPSRFLLNADARIGIGKGLFLSFKGENLLNERYESLEAYPMPGFSLALGLGFSKGKNER